MATFTGVNCPECGALWKAKNIRKNEVDQIVFELEIGCEHVRSVSAKGVDLSKHPALAEDTPHPQHTTQQF